MDFIKQGTKFILPVLIHYDLDQVRSIEFLFSQNPDRKNTSKGPENVEKFALWDSQNETEEVFREPNENIINISMLNTFVFDRTYSPVFLLCQ